jgi:predicted metal-dependent hydrolase
VIVRSESRELAAAVLEIEGRSVPVAVRRSHRARRLYLRVDPSAPPDLPVELILPRGVGLAEGLRFARDKSGWVARRLAALPPPIPFADGAAFELCGETLIIRHAGIGHMTRRDGQLLMVGGGAEHLSRRVRDWIKSQAREVLTCRSRELAQVIGQQVRGVRLGDPRSRWGSCSPDGRLAYSWRLILAPPFVLDYVVAHEVAHLVHLNHGRRFWQLVQNLVGDIDTPRAWLNRHGPRLLRHG